MNGIEFFSPPQAVYYFMFSRSFLVYCQLCEIILSVHFPYASAELIQSHGGEGVHVFMHVRIKSGYSLPQHTGCLYAHESERKQYFIDKRIFA